MDITFMQKFTAYDFTRTAFKEYIIRHNDRSLAGHVQNVLDVLDEVELLVAGGGPEIFANNVLRLSLDLAFFSHKSDAGLLAKGRIGEHHVEVFARVRGKTISHMDGTAARPRDITVRANAVQV